MARQLNFDLPVTPDFTRNGFVVSDSNALAVALIDNWQSWPQGKMILSGPSGAGKTHLTRIWAEDTGAQMIEAIDLSVDSVERLSNAAVAVENVPAIAEDAAAQTALFHLHNLLIAHGQPLLMTGVGTPNHWRMTLPDLQSRIDAAGHAALSAPDDGLLQAVLEKHFADRQLAPRPDVIPYLLPRIERSYLAALQIVAALDEESLRDRKPITRPMAAALLDKDTSDTR